jgi:hypothetical protein
MSNADAELVRTQLFASQCALVTFATFTIIPPE